MCLNGNSNHIVATNTPNYKKNTDLKSTVPIENQLRDFLRDKTPMETEPQY
jgi:hypothetical protein